MADEENDIVEVDAATRFIVAHGDIHIYKRDDEEIQALVERYWNEAIEFFTAISSHAPLTHTFGEEPFVVPGSNPEITSRSFVITYNYGSGFKIRMYNERGSDTSRIPVFHFRIEIGQKSYVDLKGILSTTQSPRLYHWALFKANRTTETIATHDLGVCIGLDNRANPPEIPEQEMLNYLSRHTRFAFCIVEAIDSIRNEIVPAVLVPQGFNITWVPDSESEIGKKINTNATLTNLYFGYQDNNPGLQASVMLTPDCIYYPSAAGQSSSMRPIKTSPVAAIEQIAAVWTPISRCVTGHTLGIVYGGQLPPVQDEPGAYYSGPRYVQLGSRYFLRCCDLFMPVNPIEDSSST